MVFLSDNRAVNGRELKRLEGENKMAKTNNFSILEHFKHSWQLTYEKRGDIARMALLPVLFLLGTIYGHFLAVQVVSGILCFLSFSAFSICATRLFYGETVGENPTRLAFKGVFWRTLGANLLYLIGVRAMTLATFIVILTFTVLITLLVSGVGIAFFSYVNMDYLLALLPHDAIYLILLTGLAVLGFFMFFVFPFFYFSTRFCFMTTGAAVGKRWSFASSLYLTENRFWFVFGNFILAFLLSIFMAFGGRMILSMVFSQNLVWADFIGISVGAFLFYVVVLSWENAYLTLVYKTLLKHNQMPAEKV